MATGPSSPDTAKPDVGKPCTPIAPLHDAASHPAGQLGGQYSIDTADELELALSEPTERLIDDLARLDGDMLILGAGGKMGPSLARMARRASDAAGGTRRVVAVSRFATPGRPEQLRAWNVETVSGDLLDASFLRILPDAKNVLYLVGMKFGASHAAAQTWALNAYLPGLIAERYPDSRIVALSTGNVYGLVPIDSGRGSQEADPPNPQGEYAMSALGRERVFEYFSRSRHTPVTIIRLNYATELRYGVLVDLALKVFRGEPVPQQMGYFNTIWQRDAAEMILRSFRYALSPPCVLNVTGPERVSCRSVCERFGQLFGRPVQFAGEEGETALLSDASRAIQLFGPPKTSIEQVMGSIASWIERGGEIWDKPTHFEVRDGNF